jgi:SAM-dependent methyltransferase
VTSDQQWTGLEKGQRPYRGTAWYYAEYRDRPSLGFTHRLAAELGWSPHGRVLDLGAGPAQVSLQIAPFVREVIAMDPEPDMIAEGKRRADAAGLENVSFVVGGSDDLEAVGPEIGSLAGAVMSQSFHWMRDQDAVLRRLDRILNSENGAVAIVGFVTDPDPNRVWLDQPPWNQVEEIRRKYLADTPAGPHPRGRHDPFPEVLRRSAFSNVELLTHEYDATIQPSIDAAIGFQYTLSNILEQLGDLRIPFEAEAHTALMDADTSPIEVRLTDSALVGRRPNRLERKPRVSRAFDYRGAEIRTRDL